MRGRTGPVLDRILNARFRIDVMPQQLIQTDVLSLCRLEMPGGVEVITRHQLFQQVISRELGPEAASILAEPIKNIEQDTVAWYTDVPGTAVHFSELDEEKKNFVRQEVSHRAAQFAELAARFKASSSSNLSLAGDLLAKVLNRWDCYDLYLVGGQAVVVGWGLASSPGRREKKERPDSSGSHIPSDPGGPAEPQPENGALPTGGAPAGGSRGLIWALALPLLGLLLGALLVAFLFRHFRPDIWPGGFKLPSLGLEMPNPDWPKFDLNQNREADLRREVERLKRLYEQRRAGCRPEPSALSPPELTDLDSPEPPALTAPELPSPPELPEPEADKDMTIPENALENKDFSFLDGCWASKFQDLSNEKTKQPIVFIYCFDKTGRASVRMEEKDEKGRLLDICRTTASAETKNQKLIIIQDGPAKCGQGGGYSRATAECGPDPVLGVVCHFQQEGSKLRPKAGFTRVEE